MRPCVRRHHPYDHRQYAPLHDERESERRQDGERGGKNLLNQIHVCFLSNNGANQECEAQVAVSKGLRSTGATSPKGSVNGRFYPLPDGRRVGFSCQW